MAKDVNVVSTVPGTAAGSLGKAEDAQHASGDTGVMALAVRKDTAAALAASDADYHPLLVDASGRLHVAPLVASTAAIGKLAANADVVIGDVGVEAADTVTSGELAGSATALQMPSVACKMVKFKAVNSNAGNVYIGASGVTVVDGTTDATSGFELGAGEETGWLTVSNINVFYRICDNAGDDLTYLTLA